MNVVDSSAWLEYLADGPNTPLFAMPLLRTADLIVPAVVVTEVTRKVLRERGEAAALQVRALLEQGAIIELDKHLALLAARLGVAHRLPLADSMVYATAQAFGGIVWTQDDDFEGLPGVRYFPKKKTGNA